MINDVTMPYFLTNEDWYEYDEEKEIFVLTDKATEKAKKSYYEYYREILK